MWGANTFPVRKYNSRTFHFKVRRSRLFRFSRRFPQINVGGDSTRIPFVEHASRESRVALPPKGRLRHPFYFLMSFMHLLYIFYLFVLDEGVSLASTYSLIVIRKSDLRSSLRTKRWLICFYPFFAKYVFIE